MTSPHKRLLSQHRTEAATKASVTTASPTNGFHRICCSLSQCPGAIISTTQGGVNVARKLTYQVSRAPSGVSRDSPTSSPLRLTLVRPSNLPKYARNSRQPHDIQESTDTNTLPHVTMPSGKIPEVVGPNSAVRVRVS